MIDPTDATPVLVAWSGGKDCLMALERLRADPRWRVVGLLTTLDRDSDRVAMHETRGCVLRAQAVALGLPLIESVIEWPASNAAYTVALASALRVAQARDRGLRHIAFGDLFLADIRAWRESLLASLDWQGIFPIWDEPTKELARNFIDSGHRALLTCVDATQVDPRFAGRAYDHDLLAELPATADACGENGEFHTLVVDAPSFSAPLRTRRVGTAVRDNRFHSVDFALA